MRRMARGALGELRRVLRVMRDELMRIDDPSRIRSDTSGQASSTSQAAMALQAVAFFISAADVGPAAAITARQPRPR